EAARLASSSGKPDWLGVLPARLAIFLILAAFCLPAAIDAINAGFHVIEGRVFRLTADDAMITFRVAYNFAHGKNLYFNEGEAVAANTSLLWPILIAPIFRVVDLDNSILVLQLLSLFLCLATLLVLVASSRSAAAAAIAGVLFVLLPSLRLYWT